MSWMEQVCKIFMFNFCFHILKADFRAGVKWRSFNFHISLRYFKYKNTPISQGWFMSQWIRTGFGRCFASIYALIFDWWCIAFTVMLQAVSKLNPSPLKISFQASYIWVREYFFSVKTCLTLWKGQHLRASHREPPQHSKYQLHTSSLGL